MTVRVKVCCIASVEEARMAVAYGASALGLVSEMPSGPGPIPEERIAEIAATVARECFWDLDAPVERVGAAATPPPYAPDLEKAWLPDRDDIAAAVRRLAAT